MKDDHAQQRRYVLNTYSDRNLALVRGDGVFLYTREGEPYLDLMSNYGVSILGYNHQAIVQALCDQIHTLTTLHGSFTNDIRASASEVLMKRCGKPYEQVYWSSSGAEAIEAALKFAVLATGKKRFIVAERGYHGKTLGALSATANDAYQFPFGPLLWEFIRVPFNDIPALAAAINDETAGFIVEPIQGEGGIVLPNSDYLEYARKLCTQTGILLITDEIQTGIGRTGTFLASQGIGADILCLGKGLAAGVPVGATIVTRAVANTIPKHIHSSTFGGNPLAMRGVLTTLEIVDDGMLAHVQIVSDYFMQRLSLLHSEHIRRVRGKGLLIGFEAGDKRNAVLQRLQAERVLAIAAGDDVVRFLPPFILTHEHVDTTVNALEKVMGQL